MSHPIASYLNDHLAGAVVAVNMLEHLESAHRGTPLEAFFAELREDILADRQQLLNLMEHLGITASVPRRVVAWVGEKMAELKLRLEDSSDGLFHLLEALEGIAIGIEGKRALWRSLTAAELDGAAGIDLKRLEARAAEQRERVEVVRLAAARGALRIPEKQVAAVS